MVVYAKNRHGSNAPATIKMEILVAKFNNTQQFKSSTAPF